MKKILYRIAAAGLLSVLAVSPVGAATLDFNGAIDKLNQKNELIVNQKFMDSTGKTGEMVILVETAYTQSVSLPVRSTPDSQGKIIQELSFGQKVSRVGFCDNGWSKVLVKDKTGEKTYGYAESYYLSDSELLTEMEEELTIASNHEVLDFPGVKNGLLVGNVFKGETVTCTGFTANEWSRIRFKNANGEESVGFVPNTALAEQGKTTVPGNVANSDGQDDLIAGEAVLKPGSSESIWAKATKEAAQESSSINAAGVIEGSEVPVSPDAKLKSLGVFKITHYCPCSICNGPWSGGQTSTGEIAQTNRTIAVFPSQIPYYSKVVINGQVYVAEDCGGAIVQNCIDVYVANHEEGNAKGVFYTDVYLIEE